MDTITIKPIVDVDSTQMVTNDKFNIVAYVNTNENGKSSIDVYDKNM